MKSKPVKNCCANKDNQVFYRAVTQSGWAISCTKCGRSREAIPEDNPPARETLKS